MRLILDTICKHCLIFYSFIFTLSLIIIFLVRSVSSSSSLTLPSYFLVLRYQTASSPFFLSLSLSLSLFFPRSVLFCACVSPPVLYFFPLTFSLSLHTLGFSVSHFHSNLFRLSSSLLLDSFIFTLSDKHIYIYL